MHVDMYESGINIHTCEPVGIGQLLPATENSFENPFQWKMKRYGGPC